MATFTGSPAKRSLKVRKCWLLSSVVGTTTAPAVHTVQPAVVADLTLDQLLQEV